MKTFDFWKKRLLLFVDGMIIVLLVLIPIVVFWRYQFCSTINNNNSSSTNNSNGTILANNGTQINNKSSVKLVACVGDSITSDGCASDKNMTYPSQLQRMLGDGYNVINYGVSGMTMMKNGYCSGVTCDGNCAYWTTDAYKDVMKSNPDIVTIMLGTNDAKGCNWFGPPNDFPNNNNNNNNSIMDLYVGYRSAYIDMIELFQSLESKPKVYVVIPPPLVNPPLNPNMEPPYNMSKQVLNEIIPVLLPAIQVETNATGGIIDVWSALGGIIGYENDTMTCDGCHPLDPAMTIIAQTIANAIQ